MSSLPDSSSLASSSPPEHDHAAAAAAAMQRLAALEQQVTAMLAQRATPTVKPKAPPMSTFNGQMRGIGGYEVDNWLREVKKQFEHYGHAAFPDAPALIRFATQWMVGDALTWWDHEDKSVIVTWEMFEARLRQRYQPHLPEEMARQRLRDLKQTGGVNSYANLYLAIVAHIPKRSEADKIFDFKQGLHPALAAKLAERQPATLQDAIDIVVNVEQFVTGKHRLNQGGYNGRPVYRGGAPSSSSSVPMDINALEQEYNEDAYRTEEQAAPTTGPSNKELLTKIDSLQQHILALQFSSSRGPASRSSGPSRLQAGRVPGLSAEDVQRLRKERKCFACKKEGHMKHECPTWKSLNA